MIFKTDGESSIKVVRDKLARQIGGKVVVESPAQGESQSNGLVEEAGKTVREFARIFKDVIETNTRTKIKSNDPILMWAIRWAAMVTSRYLVGKDGRTAQERKRGRRCRAPVAAFGELVWYKPMDKAREKTRSRRNGRRGFGWERREKPMKSS